MLERIPVEVSVEVARLRMRLDELLGLEPEAVIDLGRSAEAPVIVSVNSVPYASAEIVVVDGQLALRILELIEHPLP